MTSAHCISPFLYAARLGEYDLFSQNDGARPIDFAIAKTVVHEEYVPNIMLNDIAIVKLKRQVPVNGSNCYFFPKIYNTYNIRCFIVMIILSILDRIRPICLPLFEPLRLADLTRFATFVAGWGSTSFQGPQSSVLRDAQVPVIPTMECEKSYRKIIQHVFDDRIVCAGSGGHDACQGDSGAYFKILFNLNSLSKT